MELQEPTWSPTATLTSDPLAGTDAPDYADLQSNLSLVAEVTNQLSAEASAQLTTAERERQGQEAITRARKALDEALQHAAMAAETLAEAYKAQASHLKGTQAFLRNDPVAGKPLFQAAAEHLKQGKNFLGALVEKIGQHPMFARAIEKTRAVNDEMSMKMDRAIGKGVDRALGFVQFMQEAGANIGRMIDTVKSTPERLIESARGTGRSLAETTGSYFERFKNRLVRFKDDVKHDLGVMATVARDVVLDKVEAVQEAHANAKQTIADVRDVIQENGAAARQAVTDTVRTGTILSRVVGASAVDLTVDMTKGLGSRVASAVQRTFQENLSKELARVANADAAKKAAQAPAVTPPSGP